MVLKVRVSRHEGNLITGSGNVGPARMLHDNSSLDTEMTKRAREKHIIPLPTNIQQHEWHRGSWAVSPPRLYDPTYREEYWYYTNDRSPFQYKACVRYNPKIECYEGKVRRAGIESPYGSLRAVKDYLELCVSDLIKQQYDFYGPIIVPTVEEIRDDVI